jgi:hypothetical protein
MGDKQFYVYELRYPEGFLDENGEDLSDLIFYIGKGTVLTEGVQRVDQHEMLAGSDYYDTHGYLPHTKDGTIRRIWERSMQVKKCIAFETDEEAEALLYEREHIARYASLYLTNVKYSPVARERDELFASVAELVATRPVLEPVLPVLIHSHIHPALIVDGRIQEEGFCERIDAQPFKDSIPFVPVMITCKSKFLNGDSCIHHDGDEVVVMDVNDVCCQLSDLSEVPIQKFAEVFDELERYLSVILDR